MESLLAGVGSCSRDAGAEGKCVHDPSLQQQHCAFCCTIVISKHCLFLASVSLLHVILFVAGNRISVTFCAQSMNLHFKAILNITLVSSVHLSLLATIRRHHLAEALWLFLNSSVIFPVGPIPPEDVIEVNTYPVHSSASSHLQHVIPPPLLKQAQINLSPSRGTQLGWTFCFATSHFNLVVIGVTLRSYF